MKLNRNSTMDEICARAAEIITTPGGLLTHYAEVMNEEAVLRGDAYRWDASDVDVIRRRFNKGWCSQYFHGALVGFVLCIDEWQVVFGRDFCCGGWRVRARNMATNLRHPSEPWCWHLAAYRSIEDGLSEFLGHRVESNY